MFLSMVARNSEDRTVTDMTNIKGALLLITGMLLIATVPASANGYPNLPWDGSLLWGDPHDGNSEMQDGAGWAGDLLFNVIPPGYPGNPDDMWWYEYDLTTWVLSGTGGGISHVIVEVTPDSPAADFNVYNWVSGAWSQLSSGVEIKEHNTGPGNPFMPADMWGIKIEPQGTETTATPPAGGSNGLNYKWAIETSHIPVWGDFYVKDGGGNAATAKYLYNVNFGADPDTYVDEDQYGLILRPDSDNIGQLKVTPELPSGALLLLGALPVGLAWRRRKKHTD